VTFSAGFIFIVGLAVSLIVATACVIVLAVGHQEASNLPEEDEP
jgi:hypothetical protein